MSFVDFQSFHSPCSHTAVIIQVVFYSFILDFVTGMSVLVQIPITMSGCQQLKLCLQSSSFVIAPLHQTNYSLNYANTR